MKICSLLSAIATALFLGGLSPVPTASAQSFEIAEVQIRGNQRIDAAALALQLPRTSGSFTQGEISESVKMLYRTGFFDQVSAVMVTDGGRRVLRFELVEKPVVRRVFTKGNDELSQSELSSVFEFDARRFFDRTKLSQMIKKAVALYQSQGFYDASFEYSVLPVGENQVDLTFTVTEGKRYRVRDVQVRGLSVLDEDEVVTQLQTSRYKWWNSWIFGTGRLNLEAAEADQLRIRQTLLDNGLIDGVVSAPSVEKRDDGLYVSYDVDEGPQYMVGTIEVSGSLIEDSEELTLAGIESQSGGVFSATKIREDSFKMAEKFSDQGYAFANVVPGTSINRSDRTVDLDFSADKGNLTTVNRINIEGNDKTYDHVIRREMRIAEQEQFSGSKVRRSQEVLQRLGYFEELNIATEPVGDDKVDLNVSVREGSTGTFSAGAGYSTADGVIFNARLSENNFLGTGRRAILNLDIGTERDSYVISLDDRRVNDTPWSLGADLFRNFREFSDFDRLTTGASLSAGYPLEDLIEGYIFKDMAFGLKYEYLEAEISDVDQTSAADLVIESEGTTRASSITPRLVRNSINNPINPTEGSRQEVQVEIAGLGGNQQFYLVELEQSLYYPMWKSEAGDFVFAWRTLLGYGETFDDDVFPLYRRYFPGGINSVRGYESRSLGPKDSDGNEFGGSKQLVNNLEMIFPLINSAGLRGVVFYDVGEAFDDDVSIDFDELRHAYGFGLRWSSPLGPIRIEFGIPIDKEEGEDSLQTQFSFGAPL